MGFYFFEPVFFNSTTLLIAPSYINVTYLSQLKIFWQEDFVIFIKCVSILLMT